ncbi:uncharacterized protein YlxW (UPF0749 family) [Sphingomonas sp. BE123]|jgi:uncharacterized protein YlxW (UPF0749 family)|uniref:hypothetical protein n=1 Tax=unclassified Sphingomonas TaxID=196159 RepID=UPI0028652D00|nr:hypothetical protein [Sphingomonas sp. BE123]MDR6851236.1 uncharacterized protein YlxW (UPF0749 family) [Sphingomonas sp. BE123]
MDWAFMVVMIVAIVTIGNIVRARMGIQKDARGNDYVAHDPAASAEARRLQDEVRALKDRIAVLERVITDNHSSVSLEREIEKLRDGTSER